MTAFLSAERLGSDPVDAIIQGAPYDGGVSWRAGAAGAPASIREVSDSIESYSPVLRRDLEDLRLADAGDINIGLEPGRPALDRIADATAAHAGEGALLLTLGGDHSVSMGVADGLARVHDDLAHVVFDAHLDMRAEYESDPWSHACGTRYMSKQGPTCALGIRSGAREEFDDAEGLLADWSTGLELTETMRSAIGTRPVHLSLDLDVLDPGVLPGTGTPEPGGYSFRELHGALLALRGLRVVAIDLVEVAPRLDADGPSPYVAAKLARDLILAFAAV